MNDYVLCGWRLRSAIVFPELNRSPGSREVPADIEIVHGRVDAPPSDASPIHVFPDGTAQVTVPGVGRFLVRDGCHVTVEPEAGPPDASAIRLYLLGTVLAMLCYQRGVVPFHASAFVPDPDMAHRAVMVSGDSGVGKSTLAATFALRGAPILADDVCVIDTTAQGRPLVVPSITRLKLWGDTMRRLDIPVGPLERVRDGFDKYAWYDGTLRSAAVPAPLSVVYHLSIASGPPTVSAHPADGIAAIEVLSTCVYRPAVGVALGQEMSIARTLMAILGAVPIVRVTRGADGGDRAGPDTTRSPAELAELVARHWRGVLGGADLDQAVVRERREERQHV